MATLEIEFRARVPKRVKYFYFPILYVACRMGIPFDIDWVAEKLASLTICEYRAGDGFWQRT